ncbi:cyanophycinase [Ectobacillus antri]|uniref:Cyanophycinase n=1 Tax=Ectobacillus antri TaxID=2486280 RepID=A0ABT6H609_9BACI|nr:cyanophycinase [Ectobacillus antri]MDG4657825.1 cyanophycinase [Ectobacillus antri]MDG5754784.1 cyanophycinase [Ectobacillus antri]
MKRNIISIAACLALLTPLGTPVKAESNDIRGSLVIVGGAVGATNKAIYEAFIKRAGDGKIGIIPAASGKLRSSKDFKKDLQSYGISESKIDILQISDHDFSDTPEDESIWEANVNNAAFVDKLKDYTAIWFVGGDQLRITSSLRNDDGSNSKALDAIWDIYKDGAVLGGTSAGAAIMSDVMITGGDSLGALRAGFVTEETKTDKEYAPVYIEKGLGFFKHGIIDQHLDERSRLLRLAMTAHEYETNKATNFAYGVDEDTAMVVDNKTNTIEVVGRSGLAVVDVSKMKTKKFTKGKLPRNGIANIDISYLAPGDKVHYDTKTFEFPNKDETKGYEYYSFAPRPATGVFTPYGKLKNYLSYSLVDNSSAQSVSSYLYDSKGIGYEAVFRKTEKTNGYWGYTDGQKDDYSVAHVSLDLIPTIMEFKPDNSVTKDYKQSDFKVQATNRTDIKGNLVIAGGALGSTNRAVYDAFTSLAKGKIGIVPAASNRLSSSNSFKQDLISYGFKAEDIEILPISNHDFKGTPEDESAWKSNMNSDELANKIKGLGGIWFVGGDQTLITGSLRNDDGSDSKVLNAIWDMYANGGVLGGTSAGAAIMSDVMLAGGDSYGALLNGFTNQYDGMTQQEGGPAYLERGLGFFRYGIIDQHFDNKARLGRLITTAYEKGNKAQLSYGVDEDTAMVVRNEAKTIEVVGRGGVTLVDLANVKAKKASNYQDISLSFIKPGDTVNPETKAIAINPKKYETKGYEYADTKLAPNGGVFSPHNTLKQFVSYDLVDNAGVDKITSYSFENGKGFELTFHKGKETNGYWTNTDGQRDDYSFTKVLLDITPIRVESK